MLQPAWEITTPAEVVINRSAGFALQSSIGCETNISGPSASFKLNASILSVLNEHPFPFSFMPSAYGPVSRKIDHTCSTKGKEY